ncbi:MAG: CPBP family intramembrane metalloprotease [Gammaproteobacteria bacterium]|nr:CPBP family intramembrane metalloprotease [Gammaproteobacteria bacterium]
MKTPEPDNERDMSWRPWGFWATAGLGLVVLLVYLLLSALTVVPLTIAFSGESAASVTVETLATNPNVIVASTLVSAAIGTLLILLIAGRRKGSSWREYLSIYRPKLKELFIWLGITVATVAILGLIGMLLDRPPVHELWSELFKASAIVPLLILAVIAAPLFEESLFRGFLFPGWSQSKLGVTGTIILTAVFFTALHAQYDLFDLGQVLVLGILLGIARYRSGSLVVPIAMHALTNALAFAQMAYILGV